MTTNVPSSAEQKDTDDIPTTHTIGCGQCGRQWQVTGATSISIIELTEPPTNDTDDIDDIVARLQAQHDKLPAPDQPSYFTEAIVEIERLRGEALKHPGLTCAEAQELIDHYRTERAR